VRYSLISSNIYHDYILKNSYDEYIDDFATCCGLIIATGRATYFQR